MVEALDDGVLATDLADYLVRKGVPFRESHHLVGQVVKEAEMTGVSLRELKLAEYRKISPKFEADVFGVFDFDQSIAARDVDGGTARASVQAQIEKAKEVLIS
jgi:argininosuccinate lyase